VDLHAPEGSKTSLLFTLSDGPGALARVLEVFAQHAVSLSHIESRPSKGAARTYDFNVDIDGAPGDARTQALLRDLRARTHGVLTVDPLHVPWFPTRIADIDAFSTKTLDAGAELNSDHPGFQDAAYRERRHRIVEAAQSYKHGTPIPRVQYTANERETWGVVYRRLRALTREHAVDAFNHVLPLLEANCGYSEANIPQLQDISDFLKDCTGFTLRPVGGLLSARDFLNALAFRVFFSTQYIRHHSAPLYTPEPDIVHELLGHAPMFADPDYADFSQEIGLASLGASDNDIKALATCYWFSVEFGLARQDGRLKAYGAGLLSSFGELEYACLPTRPAGGRANFPEYRPWEPEKAGHTPYPITDYQPVYFVAESLADAKERMRAYCETAVRRPFHVKYDPFSQSVLVDRAVERGAYTVTMQT
jgi:phenylalanine-4-hydroxylase